MELPAGDRALVVGTGAADEAGAGIEQRRGEDAGQNGGERKDRQRGGGSGAPVRENGVRRRGILAGGDMRGRVVESVTTGADENVGIGHGGGERAGSWGCRGEGKASREVGGPQ